MQVKEAIETRRSVKSYDPHYKMPQTEIDALMQLAMLSPTAFNIQHWRFVVVTGRRSIFADCFDRRLKGLGKTARTLLEKCTTSRGGYFSTGDWPLL